MKTKIVYLIIFITLMLVLAFLLLPKQSNDSEKLTVAPTSSPAGESIDNLNTDAANITNAAADENSISEPESGATEQQATAPKISLSPPLPDAASRVTKKPFGIYITPQNSPVQPEKFSGYHTGTDFEIKADELEQDVLVSAICPGELIYQGSVSGYGGVLIQKCTINDQTVTVIYGHVSLSQDPATSLKLNSQIKAGQPLALLAANESQESSGERKHLHLGIHHGNNIEFRGYVNSQAELRNWLDYEEMK